MAKRTLDVRLAAASPAPADSLGRNKHWRSSPSAPLIWVRQRCIRVNTAPPRPPPSPAALGRLPALHLLQVPLAVAPLHLQAPPPTPPPSPAPQQPPAASTASPFSWD